MKPCVVVSLVWLFSFHMTPLTAQQKSRPAKMPDIGSIKSQAEALLARKEYAQAAVLYEQIVQSGLKDAATHLQIARLRIQNKEPEKGLLHLQQAIQYGFSNERYLLNDKLLSSLQKDMPEAWQLIVQSLNEALALRSHPDSVKIRVADLTLFYHTLQQAREQTRQANAIFFHEYILQGSTGLQALYTANVGHTGRYTQTTLQQQPRFYASIRQTVLSADFIDTLAIREGLRKIKQLYAEATFPDIYVTMGVHNTGAKESTTGPGLIVCAEFFARTASTDTSELSPFHLATLYTPEHITWIVVHELCHNLQRNATPYTLLDFALTEGSCDFVAGVLLEETPDFLAYHQYGAQQEEALWKEFKNEMHRKRTDQWLWNNNFGEKLSNRPADLGYYIGYKICEAYYRQAEDKTQALRDMLEIQDFKAFLRTSHYGEKFFRR